MTSGAARTAAGSRAGGPDHRGDASPRGVFVAIEGLDGVGKTTASREAARLLGAGWCTTPDPDVRALRALVDARWSPEARAIFYASSVIEAGRQIGASLAGGASVVSDRYWMTTAAYAPTAVWGALDGLAPLARRPDLTVLLTLDETERERRLRGRGEAYAPLDAVADRYAALLAQAGGRRLAIDGLSPDEVAGQIAALVRGAL